MAMNGESVALSMADVDMIDQGEGLGFGLRVVKSTRGLGRKRIVISNETRKSIADSAIRPPLKRQCSAKMDTTPKNSDLESLPHDVLVKILCGVNHEDLKDLYRVSKKIREAALAAKEWHFAYSTPKKTPVFRTSLEFNEETDLGDMEAPNAPIRRAHYKSRIERKSLSCLQGRLFT